MPKDAERKIFADPRNVAETFINEPFSVYQANGNVHVTLGVERPAAGAQPGRDMKVEREVVARLVMPATTALTLAQAISATLSPIGRNPPSTLAS